MKYSTQKLYNINPNECAYLTHIEALRICKRNAEQIKAELVTEEQKVSEWDSEKETFIKYLSKSITWCELKIEEMNGAKVTRLCLFLVHIKLAFRALKVGK